MKQNTKIMPLETIINVATIKDATKLMGRIIKQYQLGTITSEQAKTLSYLLQTYVNSFKMMEIEEQLTEYEKDKSYKR